MTLNWYSGARDGSQSTAVQPFRDLQFPRDLRLTSLRERLGSVAWSAACTLESKHSSSDSCYGELRVSSLDGCLGAPDLASQPPTLPYLFHLSVSLPIIPIQLPNPTASCAFGQEAWAPYSSSFLLYEAFCPSYHCSAFAKCLKVLFSPWDIKGACPFDDHRLTQRSWAFPSVSGRNRSA